MTDSWCAKFVTPPEMCPGEDVNAHALRLSPSVTAHCPVPLLLETVRLPPCNRAFGAHSVPCSVRCLCAFSPPLPRTVP
jgi:hypothetical protein